MSASLLCRFRISDFPCEDADDFVRAKARAGL